MMCPSLHDGFSFNTISSLAEVELRRARRHSSTFNTLKRANKAARIKMLEKASEDLVMAMVDVVKAIIIKKIPLTPRQRFNFNAHSHQVRELLECTCLNRRKKTLQQHAFLTSILTPFLSHMV